MYMCVHKSKVTHDTKCWGPKPSVVSPRNSAELPKIAHKALWIQKEENVHCEGIQGPSLKCQL